MQGPLHKTFLPSVCLCSLLAVDSTGKPPYIEILNCTRSLSEVAFSAKAHLKEITLESGDGDERVAASAD